ncbi:MAG: TfoX/Sxy family protein [Tateyamaria sp.]|uniref:TfoX/Sxy family protein n=1 Tax=Tateyamaria sp. TaxID=1929288 RepID=UPI00326F2F3A
MALSAEEIAHAFDLFAPLGPLSTRKMFGGLSIYCDGIIFAIVMSDGRVLLKGAGGMQPHFEDMGLERWAYNRKNGSATNMPYWHLPDTALDDAEEASALAQQALAHL